MIICIDHSNVQNGACVLVDMLVYFASSRSRHETISHILYFIIFVNNVGPMAVFRLKDIKYSLFDLYYITSCYVFTCPSSQKYTFN